MGSLLRASASEKGQLMEGLQGGHENAALEERLEKVFFLDISLVHAGAKRVGWDRIRETGKRQMTQALWSWVGIRILLWGERETIFLSKFKSLDLRKWKQAVFLCLPWWLGGKEATNPANAGDGVQSLGGEDPLAEEMAPPSSVLAWRIPWTEESGGYSPRGHQELDATERPSQWRHTKSFYGCLFSSNSAWEMLNGLS